MATHVDGQLTGHTGEPWIKQEEKNICLCFLNTTMALHFDIQIKGHVRELWI